MKLFRTPAFLHSSDIYEVNIRQYTAEGSFNAFRKHLPRLHNMGVTILWLMPIHPIGIKNRKGTLGSYYSITDHKGVNPEFGSSGDLLELIRDAHSRGMKVILDWVANHTAWDHVWMVSNPEYFIKDESGNFKPPYDWDDVIQIDHSNENQQQAMIEAMQFWIREYDIDGFRADLAHLTPLPFWTNARQQLTVIKKDLIWLAESEELSYQETFDITFTWKWMHATEEIVKGKPAASLREILEMNSREFGNELRLFFTSNHDENSWNGTEIEKYGSYSKALAVFSFTYLHAVPLIYSGQEIPNQKRLAFFEKDHIQWTKNPVLEAFYKTLLNYRKREPLFRNESKENFSFIQTDSLLAFQRISEQNGMIVILNLSAEKVVTDIKMYDADGNYVDIFSNESFLIDQELHVDLDPGEFMVLEKNN